MKSKFKSLFTDTQVAEMPRKHALGHPWQRGYRNHKRIKAITEEMNNTYQDMENFDYELQTVLGQ